MCGDVRKQRYRIRALHHEQFNDAQVPAIVRYQARLRRASSVEVRGHLLENATVDTVAAIKMAMGSWGSEQYRLNAEKRQILGLAGEGAKQS